MRKVKWLSMILGTVLLLLTACDEEHICSGLPQTSFENYTLESTVLTTQTVDLQMVWIPRTGTKYHSYAGCCGMDNPDEVTIIQAKAMGYTACSNCW